MPDENFDIAIRILTQQVGSEKAADILKKVREETIAGGKASVTAGEQGVKAVKEHTTHVQGLHRAYGFLGRQFGEIGHLAHFMFNPITLAIGAVAIGIKKLIEHFDNLRKVAVEMLRAANQKWEDHQIALKNAGEEAKHYRERVSEIVKSTDTLATAEANELAVLNAMIAARQKLAGDKGDEAKDDHMRLVLEEKYLQLAQEQAIAAKAKAEAARQANSGTGPDDAIAAETRKLEKLKARMKELEELAAPWGLGKTAEMAGERIAWQHENPDKEGRYFELEQRQKALEEMRANRAQQRTSLSFIGMAEGVKSDRSRAAASALDDWSAADRDVQTRQRAFATHSQVSNIQNAGSNVGLLAEASAGADIIRAGGVASDGQKAAIGQAQQLFGLLGQNSQTVLAILSRINDSQENFSRSLKELEMRLKNHAGQQ